LACGHIIDKMPPFSPSSERGRGISTDPGEKILERVEKKKRGNIYF
jgi:hypothetical protein